MLTLVSSCNLDLSNNIALRPGWKREEREVSFHPGFCVSILMEGIGYLSGLTDTSAVLQEFAHTTICLAEDRLFLLLGCFGF